ncbi:MAG: hypothetical protein P9L99_19420 [Candidatus Lernaella stagnicola]|nr:hypothetical protein [Candidatus Lernaella stagnicola]
MTDFRIRTEDIRTEDILGLYVETERDREIVESLKGLTPIIIEGSRGTGKSFLLRVAEAQMLRDLETERALPVYVSFVKSSLIHTSDVRQFQHWMLARICDRVGRVLNKNGLQTDAIRSSISILTGGEGEQSRMQKIVAQYEESYKNPGTDVDTSSIPDVQDFKDAIQDICDEIGIKRIVLMFDEAAHILSPEQQRQFFTLFRDLRSPYLNCNAAVYPGVTMYGQSFQSAHDARIVVLNRDILDDEYIVSMREIVSKQADESLMRRIEKHSENFCALAYAVTGNPRLLLKTVGLASQLSTSKVTNVIKNFYRTKVWAEHSELAERYAGHRDLVDWGRTFIEQIVIPDTRARNTQWLEEQRQESTCFFWIHRDAPEAVKEALRLLAYTGIVMKGDSGIVATRAAVGTRYTINLGCLAAPDPHPIKTLTAIRSHLAIKRFTEYGFNYSRFRELADSIGSFQEPDMLRIITTQLEKPIDVLEITGFQKSALSKLKIDTIRKALTASEAEFRQAHYIGGIRSRRIKNAVFASVFEYLSG